MSTQQVCRAVRLSEIDQAILAARRRRKNAGTDAVAYVCAVAEENRLKAERAEVMREAAYE